MAALILALLPVLSVLQPAQAASYGLTRNYQGQNFFDGWNFYNKIDDLTHGNVMYVSAKDASKANLAYVDGQGRAIMRVDNTTKLTKLSDKRNSIRIATKDQFTPGSVWVADMTHTPFGCSVWPAWWSSASVWPSGGEIDTFEGVNGVVRQQMGLHTDPGCAWTNSSTQTSTLIDAVDCSNLANNNQGCVVLNPSNASYGAPFSNAGGGVWVTEFVASGISIWFFERNAVPAALNGQMTSIDTSALGMPVANFPNSGCDVNRFFQHQSLIFDISLCGDYAGNQDIFARTCKGDCFWDYVIGDGSAYNDAYFEVNYVKVFGTSNATVVSGAASVLAPASTTVSAFALALSAFFAFVAL